MSDQKCYPVSPDIEQTALVNTEQYQQMYQQSIIDSDSFWRKQGQCIEWFTPYESIQQSSFEYGHVSIKWFAEGATNACYNCVDRHLVDKAQQTAIIWESDEGDSVREITYQQLHNDVCRFANGLKGQGVRQGDVVAIYMPMVIEAIVAMLACSRIGAVHSVVFGGFSAVALAGRIAASQAKVVITADAGKRGGKIIALKDRVDEALAMPESRCVEKVIVLQNLSCEITWHHTRDVWWHNITVLASHCCEARAMNAEEPLFILYTSGSTGVPKGLLHTTGGYLVYAATTFKYVFDYHQGDVYWCNADVGWITGHSYVVYGPLLNGATVVIHEGLPSYPHINRMSQIIDKHRVNILYTAPTTVRMLMAYGDEAIAHTSRETLRVLGSVGEPLNPKAWRWYYTTVGNSSCPIVDTWWQTETGGIMLTPLIGVTALKAGSVTHPFFGIRPALLNDEGFLVEGEGRGYLVLLDSWPGQARTIYGDHPRFMETYFKSFRGVYTTGDGAYRDKDGYFWMTGRMDDVLNISGHRIGTAEVESVLVSHCLVAEAAVVGIPHEIKGETIYAFVTLNKATQGDERLAQELRQWVYKTIGGIACIEVIQWATGLPKTRSGKIMRRILRQIAVGEFDELGDISTLADESVVKELIISREIIDVFKA